MSRNKLIATVSLAIIVITMMTSNQLSIYASPTTEDEGYTYPDDASDEEKEEIDEQEQEAYEDAGRPGEPDNDKGDDGNPQQTFTCSDESTATGDEECPPTGPNPYCDKVGPDYRGICHDRKDYYHGGPNDGLYPCNDGTNMHDWRDCKDATKKDTSSSSDNDNDIPECQNGVTQKCVISAISLICSPGYDLSNPNIVGGGHACQDIYAGIYKPQPEPEPESKLKNCGDGVVAVSCGVGRYWCSGGSGDSFHTNDYKDCKDATETETSPTSNNDNNFNPNNDNNDNSNSDNIPECKRDVLQECKLSGNTGLLCGVEDLTQGDYNPNVIGDGHACHDVYIGTYNQLEACKDGTYAVSCGSIGVLPGIP
jgi:hypothetical protein